MAYVQCHRTCEESCLQKNQQPHGSYGLNGHPHHLQGTNNTHHSSTGQYYNNQTGMLSQPGYVAPNNNNHGYSQAGTGYAHGLGLGGGYAHGNGHGHGHGGYAQGQVNTAAGTNCQGRTNYKRREHRRNMVHRMKDGISCDSSDSGSDSESDKEGNCHRRKACY